MIGVGQLENVPGITAYVTHQSTNIMPWYCDLPGFVSDRFESCIPTQEQQAAIMAQNFGKSIDPTAKAQAVTDYNNWLTSINYSGTRDQLIAQDKANPLGLPDLSLPDLGLPDLSQYLPWVIGIGAILLITARRRR